MIKTLNKFILSLCLFWPFLLLAVEMVYIDDKVLVGLHQNEDLDSAIIKTLPSGTALEVVQKGASMSLVKDPDGVRGWIDQRYLTEDPPSLVSLEQSKEKITQLETELATVQDKLADYEKYDADKTNAEHFVALNKENDELKKLLKSERVRVGQLQGQIDDLRKNLNKNNKTAGLMKQIDELTVKNKELSAEIDNLHTILAKQKTSGSKDDNNTNWVTLVLSILLSLLVGVGVGLYAMDLIVRRRHGGFRV